MDLMRRRRVMRDDKPVFVDWIQIGGSAGFLFDYTANRQSQVQLDCMWVGDESMVIFFGSRFGAVDRELSVLNDGNNSQARAGNKNIIARQSANALRNVHISVVNARNTANTNNYAKITNASGVALFEQSLSSVPTYSGRPKLPIGAMYDGSTEALIYATLKVYGFFISEVESAGAASLKYYLKPCLYRGEYGLWDTVSNTFYSNSGSGTIIGGND